MQDEGSESTSSAATRPSRSPSRRFEEHGHRRSRPRDRSAIGVRRSRSRSRRGSNGRRRSRSRYRSESRFADEEIRRSRSHVRNDNILRNRDYGVQRDYNRIREQMRVLENQLHSVRDRERRAVSQRNFLRTDVFNRRRRRRHSSSSSSEGQPMRQQRRSNDIDKDDVPTFTSKDISDIIHNIKARQPQSDPSTSCTLSNVQKSHKNILPDFDPSSKNQRVDIWLKKVNECASVYGWDEKTTIHFAMQKLQGLAKTWYESLPSILFNWIEWQEKLTKAFPSEQNYGQILEDMLKRKSRYEEPIEAYYYEKIALLNQCNIFGKNAVDCLVHGLTDRTMRSSAVSLRCSEPEQLLQFLMSHKECPQQQRNDRHNSKGKNNSDTNSKENLNKPGAKGPVSCFNCKEKGHPFLKCPKPLIKCDKCSKIGHTTENCIVKSEKAATKNDVSKTMCITETNPNSKFFKEVLINDAPVKGFIDFGSEVSLIKYSCAEKLNLVHDDQSSVLKGFGNGVVHSLGRVSVEVTVDDVRASVVCQVVEDKYLDVPLLIGQTFTEQSHVVIYKDSKDLRFVEGKGIYELPFANADIADNHMIKIISPINDVVMLCGPAYLKSVVEPQVDGPIFLDSKVIGDPSQQLMVYGGVYEAHSGFIHVLVSPVTDSCLIFKGTVISRGLEVKVVNRIVPASDDDVEANHCFIDKQQIKIGDTVDEQQKSALLNLLNKYKHCFASSLKELGCTSVTEMNIEVNSNRPIVYRPYRLSHKEREDVREMVKEMLEAGIVQESVSEYASPVILVRKKDGKMRMCIDFRMLNSVTVKERYPMPNIEDEISRLSGQAYFVTLDLTSGYYQVPISENSRHLTSFVTPDGQYEFRRMPFGLANAPAVFQRMMNRVLGPMRFDGATAYIDDVLIYGRTVEECLSRLEIVLQMLQNANLTLNLSKCEFLQHQIDYLGYEISSNGVRPGTKKIQCVLDFPRPSDQHTVRQFLGLVGYFRKFIRNFAVLAHPLTKLLTKNEAWTWASEQEEAYQLLKEKLVERPILAIYDPTAETELHTDASKLGVGGVLLQRQMGDNEFKPVAFYSRKTSPEEKNFHAYELETLAVVSSLQKFRVYLLGQKFKIVSDCSALRSTFSKRDILPRVARWWLLLQEFQCTIEYRPGARMSHVDALSRNPVDDSETSTISDQYPAVMSITSEDWLQTLQLGDVRLCKIRDALTCDFDADKLKYLNDNFLIKDNKLYKYLDGDRNNIRWVVPKGARWQLCRINHDEIGHFGVEKTLDRIKKSYWFPKMSKFVKKYVNACMECAYAKKTNTTKEGYLHPIEKIAVPFHTLHVDHLGPFVRSKQGNTHLLVVVDGFTKFAYLRPVRNTKTQSVIKTLEDIFYTFRVPDRLVSDRGSCFTSHAFKRYCTDKGVKHVLNAVASPRSNRQVERYNRTILDSLTALNLNRCEREWDEVVGKIQWGLNNTCQKTTGKSPAEIMFGTGMNSEVDPKLNEVRRETSEHNNLETIREEVKDRIDAHQEKQKQIYDKDRRPARVYNIGDLVKITKTNFDNDGKSKKLLPTYIGPYRVVAVIGNDRYKVAAIPGLTGTKHKRQTTVAADRMLPWVNVAALQVNESDTTDNESNDESTDNES